MGRKRQNKVAKILLPETLEDLKMLEESYFTQNHYLVEAVFLHHFREIELKTLCLISKYINTNQFENIPANSIQSLKENTDRILRIVISKQDFCKFLNINPMTFYQQMKNLTDLLKKSILIESIPPNKKKFIALNLFSYVGCENGQAIFGINPALQPYLHHLKSNFTIVALEYIRNMTSAYAIKIYQLLKQHELTGQRTFKIEEIKKILGITNTYSGDFSNFRKKILDVVKQNINKNSDLKISFITKKNCNKVENIIFKIEKLQNHLQKAVSEFKKQIDIYFSRIPSLGLDLEHQKMANYWKNTKKDIEKNQQLFQLWIENCTLSYNPQSTQKLKIKKIHAFGTPHWYNSFLQTTP